MAAEIGEERLAGGFVRELPILGHRGLENPALRGDVRHLKGPVLGVNAACDRGELAVDRSHLSSRVGHRHVGHLRRDDDPIVEWTRENRGQQGVAREQQRLYLAEPDEDGVGGTHRRILSDRLTLPDGGTSSIIMVAVWSNCYASYQGETEWTFTLYCDQGGAPQHTRRVSSGAAEAPSRERS
jgi:hypothetical protein